MRHVCSQTQVATRMRLQGIVVRARHKEVVLDEVHARLERLIWGDAGTGDVIERDVAFARDHMQPALEGLLACTVRDLTASVPVAAC